MLRCRRNISLLLILSAVWLSGCNSSHANPAPARRSLAKSQTATTPAAKHPPRDSAFSVYNNSTYGVSFRYPRTYLLKEELNPDDSDLLTWQQQLEAQQPDAMLVATVLIPDDAYPNTTFRGASLQLVVNSVVQRETCQSFAVPLDEAYTSGSTSAQGITFNWRQRGSAAAGTGYLNRDYAGFSNGTCYEFSLEVVTGSNPDLDPRIKDANETKILRHLDKIVSSLQLHSPQPSSRPL